MYKFNEWQARAQQPASVAVPEPYRSMAAQLIDDWDSGHPSYDISALGKEAVSLLRSILAAAPHPISGQQKAERLSVWEGSIPESNGKTNYTAILHKGDISEGMTIASSEYPDRVRYEADEVRWLIGERDERPDILDYDADKHSGYTPPPKQAAQDVAVLLDILRRMLDQQHSLGRDSVLIREADAALATLLSAQDSDK